MARFLFALAQDGKGYPSFECDSFIGCVSLCCIPAYQCLFVARSLDFDTCPNKCVSVVGKCSVRYDKCGIRMHFIDLRCMWQVIIAIPSANYSAGGMATADGPEDRGIPLRIPVGPTILSSSRRPCQHNGEGTMLQVGRSRVRDPMR
jgi:hypothetical protein